MNCWHREPHPRLLGRTADVEELLRQSGNPDAADEADLLLPRRRRRRRLLNFPPSAETPAHQPVLRGVQRSTKLVGNKRKMPL